MPRVDNYIYKLVKHSNRTVTVVKAAITDMPYLYIPDCIIDK